MQDKLHSTDQRCLEIPRLVLCSAEIAVTLSIHITPPILDFIRKKTPLLVYELRLKIELTRY
jgi:hypothetical protein